MRQGLLSVVVVTYKRPAELRSCLDGLSRQTVLPFEIIVVDNAGGVGSQARQICAEAGLPIRYMLSPRNSLPAARNAGSAKCSCEFMAFIDDDVRLAPDYFEAVLATFAEHPDAVGVQGYIDPGHRARGREFVHRIFGLYHVEAGGCRVLPAISTTYPAALNQTIRCEWMSGTNQVYRREVLEHVHWDEQLLKYADGEDLDHSFRVHQRYPKRLYITPAARVEHDESVAGRAAGYELIAMREVYGWYLLNKLFSHSFHVRMAYAWSRIGRLAIAAAVAAAGRRRGDWSEVWSLVSAYALVRRNARRFASGDLGSFNASLVSSQDRDR